MKNFIALLMSFALVGCMSMPKPDAEEMKKIPLLMQKYRDTLSQDNPDAAIEALEKAKVIITKKMELAGGKGANFNDEARLTALIANIEFNRGNVESAAKKWIESFDVQYNGLKAKNEVDEMNARIGDAIATGISQSTAQSIAKSSGQKSYTYTVYNTPVPKPLMINMGLPEGSVLRIPVQVEAHPFDKIVKLNNNDKGSCTATMISSRIAISAAHCMSVDGVAIDPSVLSLKRMGIVPSQPLKVKEYFTHLGSNQGWDRKRKNDWLILVADKDYDIGGVFPTIIPFIPISVLKAEEKVMLGGYSSDLSKGFYLTLHHGCNFKFGQTPTAGIFFTNCENAKGSSGAAVMTTEPPYKVVAIHTAHLADPKDEFHSVVTFTPDFVKTLAKVSLTFGGLTVMAENTSTQENIQGVLTVPSKRQEGESALESGVSQQSSGETAESEQRRKEAKHRALRLAGASASSIDVKGTAAQIEGHALRSYGAKIAAAIRANLVQLTEVAGNPSVEYDVYTDTYGNVLSAKLRKKSGYPTWDEAALSAIMKTGKLPLNENGRVPSPMTIVLQPSP